MISRVNEVEAVVRRTHTYSNDENSGRETVGRGGVRICEIVAYILNAAPKRNNQVYN